MAKFDTQLMKDSCLSCSLKELCLPKGLSPDSLYKLAGMIGSSHLLQAKDFIFEDGDNYKGLYAVKAGAVKMYTKNDGIETIIGFYLPGDILGIDGMYKETYNCSVVALETTSYCFISAKELRTLCHKNPEISEQLLKTITSKLTNDNSLILKLSKKSSDEKIAVFLITLSNRFKQLGYSANEIKIPMSRQDIACYLNITTETLSRGITKLIRLNLIEQVGKKIIIKRKNELVNYAVGNTAISQSKAS